MEETDNQPAKSCITDLIRFPERALTIILCFFVAFVPLAYSPKGAEFEGLFDDFYYKPKLTIALYLVCFVAAFWLLRMLAEKRHLLKFSPVFLYVAAFIVSLSIATALSPWPDTAFWGRQFRSEGFLAFLMYAAAFFLFSNCVDTEHKLKNVLSCLVLGACIASVYGLLQFFGFDPLPRDHVRLDWWRAFATSGNPGFLAAYLLLVLPFPVFFVLYPRSGKQRVSWLWLPVAGLIFTCILATYHRGAWVGLAAGTACAVVLVLKRAPVQRLRAIALAVVFAACAIGFDRAAVANGRPSLVARAVEGTGEGPVSSSTIRVRTYIWRATLPLIAKRPAFGWGPDTMCFVKMPKPAEFGYEGRMFTKPDKPENLLLQIAYEGGLASLVPFLLAVGVSLITMWRASSQLEGYQKVAAMAIIVAIVSYLAQQQFSFSTLSSSPIFWSLLGLGLALTRLTPAPPAPPRGQ